MKNRASWFLCGLLVGLSLGVLATRHFSQRYFAVSAQGDFLVYDRFTGQSTYIGKDMLETGHRTFDSPPR